MMQVEGQEGYLLWMDELHPQLQKGHVLKSQNTGEEIVVVYIDRDEDCFGFLPMSEFE
jgi:hypothetical protein